VTVTAAALEQVFADCFGGEERTRLVGGAEEPLYQPAAAPGHWHTIHYRADYPASALHEVAHWCIAGPARRRLRDYGYWYAPDGRDAAAQRDFEAVEARPQGLEWLFAQGCGLPFRLSLDNLDGELSAADRERFAAAVAAEALAWQARGPRGRAGRFLAALVARFPAGRAVNGMQFSPAALR
jgi:elongation factor P hydroxylase